MYSNTTIGDSRGRPCDNTNYSSALESLASGGGAESVGVLIAAGSSTEPAHHPEDDGKRTQEMDGASLLMNDYYTDDGDEVGDDGKASPTDKCVYAPQSDEVWDENFEVLRNFYTQYGHCNVPFSDAWTDLANWLYRQNRRQSRLKLDQRARLAAVGALNQPPGRQTRHASWDERFAELIEFKKRKAQ